MKLLTTGNPKTSKSKDYGYATAILHLAPHTLSGVNVCPFATEGCIASCLNTAGRGGIIRKGETTNRIQEARVNRTRLYLADPETFLAKLEHEIDLFAARTYRAGLKAAVRLNGTSDIAWEAKAPQLFERFPDVQFYDYTKSLVRALRNGRSESVTYWNPWPSNYHLTYSRTEHSSIEELGKVLDRGVNVAIVYDKATKATALRQANSGYYRPCVDGDVHDLRFLDTPQGPDYSGNVIALLAKGKARQDSTGFVVRGGKACS
jgi:hypothetical protein